jgi:hypothetical protein
LVIWHDILLFMPYYCDFEFLPFRITGLSNNALTMFFLYLTIRFIILGSLVYNGEFSVGAKHLLL